MTVMMYRSPQYRRRGKKKMMQKTREDKAREWGRVNLAYGKIKRVAFFFSWQVNLMVSTIFLSLRPVPGKLKILFNFGFIVSLLYYFVYIY